MKAKWTVYVAVLSLAGGADAKTITREYVESKVCGDQLSYELCRESLLLQLRSRFAEEVVGAYVQSQSQTDLAGRDESVQKEIRSLTMSRATMRLDDDDAHRQYYDSGGVLTLRVHLAIDDATITRFQRKLDQETHVAALADGAPPQIPRDFRFAPLNRERIAIYMDVGATRSITSGGKVGLVGALGIEYIAPPLALDLMVLGSGDGDVSEGKPGTTIGGGLLALKLLPVNRPSFALAIGAGLGVAEIEQYTPQTRYHKYGGQAVGLVQASLFPGSLRLKLSAMYRKTRFSEDNGVPILLANPKVGDGLFYTLGFSLEM